MDALHMLLDIVRALYAQVPWLVWGVAICLGTCLWFALLALIDTAWRLCTSQDDRDWFRFLRHAKRDHRRQQWAKMRADVRMHTWHRGDGKAILGLLALAALVIAVCR